MKFLGIDYGSKRIGVAVSDAAGAIAFPRKVVPNDDQALPRILRSIEDERVGACVVGDTLGSSGAENPVTAQARRFSEELQRQSALPVVYAPELWSSIEAARYAPEGGAHDDSAAAAIILQRYLDMKGGSVQ
jgi:putative Holliday junction resolvase